MGSAVLFEWPRVPLGEAIELAYGKALPKRSRLSGDIPVYGSNGQVDTHNESFVEGPTIIVGRKGSVGAVHYVEGPCCPIDTTYYVNVRPGVALDIEFIYWQLAGLNLSRLKTETGVPGLNREDAYRESFLLPPLDEQRRIVDILKRAGSIRRLRKQALKTTQELIPAIFVDMFGDPATNPKGWEMVTIGEVLTDVDYGTSQKATEAPAGLPVLRMGNVNYHGDLDLENLKYAELTMADRDKYLLQAGDLLFNRTNSKELVGKVGIWDGRFDAVAASYFIRLRADRTKCHPVYLWVFFNTRFMKQRLFETARGAIGQSNINAKELKAFPVAQPPLALQEEFAHHIENTKALIRQQEDHERVSFTTMLSLMAKFFG